MVTPPGLPRCNFRRLLTEHCLAVDKFKMDTPRDQCESVCLSWILDAVEAVYSVHLHEIDASAPAKKKLVSKFETELTRGGASEGHNVTYGVFLLCSAYLRRDHMPKGTRFPDFCATVATSLAENLTARASSEGPSFLHRVASAGPFLHFFFHVSYTSSYLLPSIFSGGLFAREPTGVRVMVEYSQPNTHKMFHVGHMRNVALGHSLILLNEFVGHEVVSANYIGDIGAHIAKCLWYYLEFYPDKKAIDPYRDIEMDVPPGMQKVEWLGSMYRDGVAELDFGSWTKFPFLGYKTVRVQSKEEHPSNDKWSVCVVSDSEDEYVVVCGGVAYQTGDIVAYAPVGSKKGGKDVGVIDKAGVESHGILLSKAELGIQVSKKNRMDLMVFPPETTIGMSVAEVGRNPRLVGFDEVVSLEEEFIKRNDGFRNILTRLEEKDPDMVELWNITRQWSLDDFDVIYRWLGAPFDHCFYESDVDVPSKEYALEMHRKGVFVESHGAIGMSLQKFGLGFAMVLTSAGNGLYLTKDLELAKLKFNDFNIDRSLYVVDVGQSRHFQQVFKVLELLGFEQAKQCEHVAYGLVTLPRGKMSSRSGTVIPFAELKERITECIRQEYFTATSQFASIKKRALIDEMSDEEIEDAIHQIAVCTIRYGMLNQDPSKNIVFEMDRWVGKKGNTGPYIMYAYTRTASILKKNADLHVFPSAEEEGEGETAAEVDYSFIPPECAGVLAKLEKFVPCVELAVENSKPSVVSQYLFSLCQDFSSMYEIPACSALKNPDIRARIALLHVYKGINVVLKKGLSLLGVETLERM